MTTAAEKKDSHIVEYVLYVWQMEDVVRATGFDSGAIRSLFGGEDGPDLDWVLTLSQDMVREGLHEDGHVSHVQETLTELALLHDLLTGPMEDANYVDAYKQAEPLLSDFEREKMKSGMHHPTEVMLTALYGWLVLRLKKEPISLETNAALVAIRSMANALARGHIRVYQGR